MQVRLRVMCGAHAGKEIRVPVSRFLIGRGEQCHLRPASDVVSRKHCAILVEDERVVLQDFGSKNGTYVNGERVVEQIVMQPGDALQIGPLKFQVVIEKQSAKRPVVKDVKDAARRATQNRSEQAEDEITSWLEGPSDAEGLTKSVDSRIFKLDETTQLEAETATNLSDAEETQTGTDSGKWTKKDAKAQKSKFEPPKKQTASDSREAAAETLRKFFSRR